MFVILGGSSVSLYRCVMAHNVVGCSDDVRLDIFARFGVEVTGNFGGFNHFTGESIRGCAVFIKFAVLGRFIN